MNEVNRGKRNALRLTQLFPAFRLRLLRVISDLEALGRRPRIQDAWRSPADQKIAFDTGHSQLLFGFHNVTAADGTPEALAVDLLDDNAPVSPGLPYLLQLAACAEANGLVTGIRFGLPAALEAGVNAAIAARDWKAKVKIGWDPTHVQPIGITPAQARAGARPG